MALPRQGEASKLATGDPVPAGTDAPRQSNDLYEFNPNETYNEVIYSIDLSACGSTSSSQPIDPREL